MATEVRQRVTRELLGRRGTTADPVWVNRRLLLTSADHLSTKQWTRLAAMLNQSDPTGEVDAAWGVKNAPAPAPRRAGTIEDPGGAWSTSTMP